jgi:hypothetical protein
MNDMHHTILLNAIDATTERTTTHGAVEDNFEHTASLWSAYLGFNITATDVCQMQVLAKISRAKKGNPLHPDHYVDQCGYSSLAGRMAISSAAKSVHVEQLVKQQIESDFAEMAKHFSVLKDIEAAQENEGIGHSSGAHDHVHV